jgi:hypothetical protein
MVKVQNGWQTRSLDEIESIASASPRSAASGFTTDRAAAASPRRQMQQRVTRKWSDSSSSESGRSDLYTLASSRLTAVPEMKQPGAPARGLAPPADIVSGQRRRPSPNDAARLNGIGPGRSQDLRRLTRPSPSQRTPSQNAAMEADAVETLLFMASPNNSGYHPPSQASQESSLRSTQTLSAMTSPLRTQFSQTSMTSPKKVAFSEQDYSNPVAQKNTTIDQMLDNLPDESDDELAPISRLDGSDTKTMRS